MERLKIKIEPEVIDFLENISFALVREGYKSTLESAIKYESDIYSVLNNLNSYPHYRISSETAYHFERYGHGLWYTFFKRKDSKRTTWYVFFEKSDTRIIVKHISNNWIEGQYIR